MPHSTILHRSPQNNFVQIQLLLFTKRSWNHSITLGCSCLSPTGLRHHFDSRRCPGAKKVFVASNLHYDDLMLTILYYSSILRGIYMPLKQCSSEVGRSATHKCLCFVCVFFFHTFNTLCYARIWSQLWEYEIMVWFPVRLRPLMIHTRHLLRLGHSSYLRLITAKLMAPGNANIRQRTGPLLPQLMTCRQFRSSGLRPQRKRNAMYLFGCSII